MRVGKTSVLSGVIPAAEARDTAYLFIYLFVRSFAILTNTTETKVMTMRSASGSFEADTHM